MMRSSRPPRPDTESRTLAPESAGCDYCDAPIDRLRAPQVHADGEGRVYFFCSSNCSVSAARRRRVEANRPKPAVQDNYLAPHSQPLKAPKVPSLTAEPRFEIQESIRSPLPLGALGVQALLRAPESPTPQEIEQQAANQKPDDNLTGESQPSHAGAKPGTRPRGDRASVTPIPRFSKDFDTSSEVRKFSELRKQAESKPSTEQLFGLSLALGILLILTAWLGNSTQLTLARLALANCIAIALAWAYLKRRDERHLSLIGHGHTLASPSQILFDLWPLLLALVAVWQGSFASTDEHDSAILSYSLLCLLVILGQQRIDKFTREISVRSRHLSEALEGDCYRWERNHRSRVQAGDLRPGELVVVGSGERCRVDMQITHGNAKVQPWYGSSDTSDRGPGELLVAGSRVLSGQLRGVVTWTGNDRSSVKLFNDPSRRIDLHHPIAKRQRRAARSLSPILSIVVFLIALGLGSNFSTSLSLAAAVALIFCQPFATQLPGLLSWRSISECLEAGISFNSPEALDRAGQVISAVFCARGTLVLGEPELTSIETVSGYNKEELLSLACGVLQSSQEPGALAIRRAAQLREIRPHAVRMPQHIPGMGHTGVDHSGDQLLVGNRSLLLSQKVSIAKLEERMVELEAAGRSILLISVRGRLAGLVALQDGLRPGARAAVQELRDASIEPILMSGEARETCASIGRAVDISYLRPEVLPHDRAQEIVNLRLRNEVVAVLGTLDIDEPALQAADLSIGLSSAGSSTADYDVHLASDRVHDATKALIIAHYLRRHLLRLSWLPIGVGTAATLVVLVLSLSPWWLALALCAVALVEMSNSRSNKRR